jgi:hypothetical protein
MQGLSLTHSIITATGDGADMGYLPTIPRIFIAILGAYGRISKDVLPENIGRINQEGRCFKPCKFDVKR